MVSTPVVGFFAVKLANGHRSFRQLGLPLDTDPSIDRQLFILICQEEPIITVASDIT